MHIQMIGSRALVAAALLAALSPPVSAATVSGGTMVVNLDRDALADAIAIDATAAPSMYLEEFFDAPAANSRTATQILEDHIVPGVAEIPAKNLTFSVNGTHVANLTGRHAKPTTIEFDPANFASTVTGVIGLSGVFRFRVDTGSEFNRILSGDYALEYDAANMDGASGRSAWSLYNHVSFRSQSYNLFNVVLDIHDGSLDLSGELGLGEGYDHLFGTRDAIVGNFSLHTSVVPVPASIWLFVSGLGGLARIGMRRRQL
ncbi:VPLPA-CTERM sorting domain-containing protein [Methylomonas sp. MV1]|uniref:VPLPA-CTERM sorting domain-containing protein n=2 Tax=unclassified Methylomonas TaxID=2608980 RepID=UPI0028A55EE6|nr:VPLPA-CTERM sorting domain-containing protein [Methylomonas sp. MV1]MDT4329047.1 VPLPA-CTERM sorting domain-containing protein [Methylomonas sp. MV1]